MHFGIYLFEHMFDYWMHVHVLILLNKTYMSPNIVQTNLKVLSKSVGIERMQRNNCLLKILLGEKVGWKMSKGDVL